MNYPDYTYRILLVDDDEIDRKVFKRSLRYLNTTQELMEASSLEEAIHILHHSSIDCVFLDYRLGPSVTGMDVMNRMKADKLNVSVAIMTSHGDEHTAVELLKAGAIDYVNKSELTPEKIDRILHAADKIKAMEQGRLAAEKAVNEHIAQLEAVIESTSAAVFALDTSMRYTAFNSSYASFVKRTCNIKINIGDLFVSPTGHDTSIALHNVRRGLSGEHFTEEEEYMVQNFDVILLEVSYNPVKGPDGVINGVAAFAQDITEKKRNELALLKARNDALKAAQAKSDFLSNMSHEIRTPMNAIIGITELLMDRIAIPENKEYLQSIKYSADNLLFIINDILDFSKIEAGKITLEYIPFSLPQKIDELKKSFLFKTNEKGLELSVQIAEEVPQYVLGDPYRLNQILFNLVGNAIKFTKQGKISIDVAVKKQEGESYRLLFSVTDTGIGISPDKQQTIFESFTQAYTDTARKFGGTGLGLAISKNLVELQQGYIGVKSTPGQGSTFFFEITYKATAELPIGQTAGNMANDQSVTQLDNEADRNLNGARILLVEDNTMNQFVARQILKKWNAEVSIAETGLEALNSLKTTPFDVVLMDLQMPEMSGYEATNLIRNGGHEVLNPHIPIIALTADAFDETRSKVLDAGMNDFITKPFKQDELFGKIVRHIRLESPNLRA